MNDCIGWISVCPVSGGDVLTSHLHASRNRNVRLGLSTSGRAAKPWCRIATLSNTPLLDYRINEVR